LSNWTNIPEYVIKDDWGNKPGVRNELKKQNKKPELGVVAYVYSLGYSRG
jgi:hypothetical protein